MSPTPSQPPFEIHLDSEARVGELLTGRLWAGSALKASRVTLSLRLRDQAGEMVLELPAGRLEIDPAAANEGTRFSVALPFGMPLGHVAGPNGHWWWLHVVADGRGLGRPRAEKMLTVRPPISGRSQLPRGRPRRFAPMQPLPDPIEAFRADQVARFAARFESAVTLISGSKPALGVKLDRRHYWPGDRVVAEVIVLDPARVGRAPVASLECVYEWYASRARRFPPRIYPVWEASVPIALSSGAATVVFEPPPDGPASYFGKWEAIIWRVAVRQDPAATRSLLAQDETAGAAAIFLWPY